MTILSKAELQLLLKVPTTIEQAEQIIKRNTQLIDMLDSIPATTDGINKLVRGTQSASNRGNIGLLNITPMVWHIRYNR